MLDASFAILFEEVDDRFRVAVGAVLMAFGDQGLAQGAVVVDFAVEDDPERAIFVGDGLVAGFEVDDAEAAQPSV